MNHALRSRGTRRPRLLSVVALLALPLLWSASADGADLPPQRNQPHAGYVYPAGGQVGTTFRVDVGGQYLRRVDAVRVSGEGVHARVLMWMPPAQNLDARQRRELQRQLREAREAQQGTATPGAERRRDAKRQRRKQARKQKDDDDGEGDVTLPRHPLLENLDQKTPEELIEVARFFFRRRDPLQRKRSIAEIVRLEVTIDPDAEPGMRDLRLQTRGGTTNPIRFRVGLLPEVRETETLAWSSPEPTPFEVPAVVNGQLLPRDVDRFVFDAREGQRLLVRAEARSLVPYQADSVPGWMQTVLAIHDEDGQEVAYADEYRYDPDPVLFFEVPETGTYVLHVRDAISRGRDDFVYRVAVGELPFITRIFPLGGREGELVQAEVEGWNLGWRRVPLDTRPGSRGMRATAWRQTEGVTNEVAYAVDTLPEITESEPNDEREQALAIDLPQIVNGRIDEPGDVDLFAFQGRARTEVVVEVTARQLGSPIDTVVRLEDAKGNVVAWNDDYVHEGLGTRGLGLQTHHADSYLRAELPRGGTYFVRVADVRRHGGIDHAYRLRVSPPRPDVEVFLIPSNVNVPSGRAALVSVRAIRKDGYEGDIDIALKDAPKGFELGGATIPAGQDRVLMTLTAPQRRGQRAVSLDFVARIQVGRETIERPLVPADDVMQAFLWRHVVPAEELAVTVVGSGRWVHVTPADDEPIRVRRGRKARVAFVADRRLPLEDLRFKALDPPKGVRIGEATRTRDGFTLEIHADRSAQQTGHVDNLIVEAFTVRRGRSRPGKEPGPTREVSLGYLPAIPFKIIRR